MYDDGVKDFGENKNDVFCKWIELCIKVGIIIVYDGSKQAIIAHDRRRFLNNIEKGLQSTSYMWPKWFVE